MFTILKITSISIKPSFKPIKNLDFEVIFKIVNISGVGGKVSYGGFDTIAIQTEYNFSTVEEIIHVKYINISTAYKNAWNVYANSTLKATGLEYGLHYEIVDLYNHGISIIFAPPTSTNTYGYPVVRLTNIDILGQIGPGWIE